MHVRTYKLTGDITGVCVVTIDWFVDWIVEGYVCPDNPIKFPNAVLNVNCGVWFDIGNDQVAPLGFEYPSVIALTFVSKNMISIVKRILHCFVQFRKNIHSVFRYLPYI